MPADTPDLILEGNLDPLVRVVAIAVQGLLNRSPKRALESLNVREAVDLRAWAATDGTAFALTLLKREKNRPIDLDMNFVPSQSGEYEWWAPYKVPPFGALRWAHVPQKKIEERAASFFTTPFAVERVEEDALWCAEYYVERVAKHLNIPPSAGFRPGRRPGGRR